MMHTSNSSYGIPRSKSTAQRSNFDSVILIKILIENYFSYKKYVDYFLLISFDFFYKQLFTFSLSLLKFKCFLVNQKLETVNWILLVALFQFEWLKRVNQAKK